MTTQHSGQTFRPSDDEIRRTIQCVICQATYAPAPLHQYLLQHPPIALESAFMSICHFCFRCRRPACPDCWDDVHGVCGACSLEANLPFRTAPAPLSGAVFAPSRQEQAARGRPTSAPLVCVRPGRFQQSSVALTTPSTEPAHPVSMTTQAPEKQVRKPQKQRQEPALPRQHLPTPRVSPRDDISELATRPVLRRDTRTFKSLEYVLTITSFTVLLIVLLLIG
jgi:hypothetical protein